MKKAFIAKGSLNRLRKSFVNEKTIAGDESLGRLMAGWPGV
jgi:hypothetical protein